MIIICNKLNGVGHVGNNTERISHRRADAARKQPSPKYLDSRALFEDAQEIRIDHDGQEYRLRQTRNGKLILTK